MQLHCVQIAKMRAASRSWFPGLAAGWARGARTVGG